MTHPHASNTRHLTNGAILATHIVCTVCTSTYLTVCSALAGSSKFFLCCLLADTGWHRLASRLQAGAVCRSFQAPAVSDVPVPDAHFSILRPQSRTLVLASISFSHRHTLSHTLALTHTCTHSTHIRPSLPTHALVPSLPLLRLTSEPPAANIFSDIFTGLAHPPSCLSVRPISRPLRFFCSFRIRPCPQRLNFLLLCATSSALVALPLVNSRRLPLTANSACH